MTTIAWDGETLAADTQWTFGGDIDAHGVKIVRKGPVLAGASGTTAYCVAFLDWFKSGMVGDAPPCAHPTNSEWSYWGLIIHPPTIMLLMETGWIRLAASRYALGSGANFATGAMDHGATAEDAVRIAMKRDSKSGGDVTVLKAA